jgi:ribosomal protein S18 acetylase RimI-like enzyme
MIEGKGKAKIGDNWEDLKSFNPKNRESWYVIDKNLPHEFYPEGHEMVVISFHTCLSKELIEIKSDSGEHRLYERSRNSTSNPYHSSEKWKIRHHIKPGDMGYLTYLHGILYAKEYGYNQAFEAYVASILSKFVQSFNPKKDRIWLAEIKNQIIGSIIIIGHSRVKAQLRCFLVHPDYRGLGLGKELIKEALQFCKECKYKTVFLFTESELGAARHLYACAGFRKIGEKTHKNWGKRVTEEKYDLNL